MNRRMPVERNYAGGNVECWMLSVEFWMVGFADVELFNVELFLAKNKVKQVWLNRLRPVERNHAGGNAFGNVEFWILSVELSALPMWNCSMLNYALCAMLSFECWVLNCRLCRCGIIQCWIMRCAQCWVLNVECWVVRKRILNCSMLSFYLLLL